MKRVADRMKTAMNFTKLYGNEVWNLAKSVHGKCLEPTWVRNVVLAEPSVGGTRSVHSKGIKEIMEPFLVLCREALSPWGRAPRERWHFRRIKQYERQSVISWAQNVHSATEPGKPGHRKIWTVENICPFDLTVRMPVLGLYKPSLASRFS